MKIKNIVLAFCAVISLNAFAGMTEVGPVYLDSVTIIGPNAFRHEAGNMEVKITNGIGYQTVVSCSADYITTKKTTPNFNEMLSMLIAWGVPCPLNMRLK